ncbi:MAG: PAS domain-containing protein [Campylobacterota bacterium]|nr:PAS domain-containing protein [Campylobacterota bacterium]
MNKKIILIILFIFILINSIVYKMTDINSTQRIEATLEQNLQRLKTRYEILLKVQNTIALTLYDTTINDKVFIDILSKARYVSTEQQKALRDKLQLHLKGNYRRAKMQGILQYHFIFPDNRVFLRMHKPSKFGDDLSNVRDDFRIVNKTQKPIRGFTQGRTYHGFRNTFPIFDFDGKHIGAMEISFPSENFQQHLTQVSHIHSHFLVNKDVFDTKEWKRDDLILKYQQSAEHPNYMITITNQQHTKDNCIVKNSIKIQKIKDKINTEIKNGEEFSTFVKYDECVKVISFLPIKNIENKTVAWLVSYEKSDFIKYTLNTLINVRGFAFFFSLIIAYFVFKQQQLFYKLKIKTKEQSNLLSLFNKGEAVLFRWNNDDNWSIDFVSDNTEQLLGYTKEQFLQNSITYATLIHNDDKQLVIKEVTEAITQNKDFFTLKPYRLTTKNGELKWILDNTLLIKDEQGNITHFLGTVSDITQIKNSEALIAEQSKLVSMGEMIGNIAHQWRQPLSVISTGATGLKLQKECNTLTDEKFMETCNLINNNAQYLSKTIDDFRNFIKGDREIIEFKLLDGIKSFLHLVEGSIKNNNIKIIENLDENITLNGYPNELTQCFINIFNNSKDAFKDKDIEERLFFISTTLEEDKVIISFKDNANGIPKDILPKVFEPYFTTKHKSQGTGLGLHMTFNLITKGMGSSIIVQNIDYQYKNEEYSGALFTIKLPLIREK